MRPINRSRLDVRDGELVLLLEASGCGKTTLLSALAAAHARAARSTSTTPEVTQLKGKALAEYRRRTVGVVYQAFNLIPSLNALDNVAVAAWNTGQSAAAPGDRAPAVLAPLELTDGWSTGRPTCRGGEQQRSHRARCVSTRRCCSPTNRRASRRAASRRRAAAARFRAPGRAVW